MKNRFSLLLEFLLSRSSVCDVITDPRYSRENAATKLFLKLFLTVTKLTGSDKEEAVLNFNIINGVGGKLHALHKPELAASQVYSSVCLH